MHTDKKILIITSNLFYDTRIAIGLSQEQMAEKLKICRREYQYIEYGQRCCSVETWSNLANECGVDVTDAMYSISKISQATKE